VRPSHLNEVLIGENRHLFQAEENRIRVLERRWRLDLETPSSELPKLLYTAVRTRAHPVVMEKGLKPAEGRYIVLSPDQDMARRIGRRRDQIPVLLEVMPVVAKNEGILFYPFGSLFLSPRIPPRFIVGPPIAKESLASRKDTDTQKEQGTPRPVDFTPGSFTLDISRDPDPYRRAKGKKHKGWKEEAKKMRRRKRG
jgi:putative RNA 2'-phosphotransferase